MEGSCVLFGDGEYCLTVCMLLGGRSWFETEAECGC